MYDQWFSVSNSLTNHVDRSPICRSEQYLKMGHYRLAECVNFEINLRSIVKPTNFVFAASGRISKKQSKSLDFDLVERAFLRAPEWSVLLETILIQHISICLKFVWIAAQSWSWLIHIFFGNSKLISIGSLKHNFEWKLSNWNFKCISKCLISKRFTKKVSKGDRLCVHLDFIFYLFGISN